MSEEAYENRFIDIWGYIPRVKKAIKARMNIMLRGPTGTGKTFLLGELAKEHKKTLFVTNMTCGATTEEIKGRYVVQPDEDGKTQVKWVDGILVTAMKKGAWLVIEEANFMPEELASVFYSVMDDRRNTILDEHENEVVTAHEDFRLFLTGNWGYKGTVIPNDAIRNRIDVYFDLKYLPEREEGKLIARETGVSSKIANLITKFAWKQRRIKSRHQPDISTRILIRWATLIQNGMTPIEAGEHTIIALLFHEESEKEKVREALKFEFEAIEDEMKPKGKATESASSEDVRAKVKSGDTINIGDLVSISKGKMKYFGRVTKITTSRSGKKIWALWNDDRDKAIKGVPCKVFPLETADLASRVILEATSEELEK